MYSYIGPLNLFILRLAFDGTSQAGVIGWRPLSNVRLTLGPLSSAMGIAGKIAICVGYRSLVNFLFCCLVHGNSLQAYTAMLVLLCLQVGIDRRPKHAKLAHKVADPQHSESMSKLGLQSFGLAT